MASSNVVFIPGHEPCERLIGFSLDVLELVDDDGLSKMRVAGWIETRGRSVRAICFHSGYGAMRLEVAPPRNDVAAALSAGRASQICEFRGIINVGGLGATFSLVVTAAQDADTQSAETMIWLGEIAGRQQSLSDQPLASAMAPISVTCLGRTGSTLMMRILSAHPAIVVAGGYPHETKYAQEAFRNLGDNLDAMLPHGEACIRGTQPYRQFRDNRKRDMLGMTVSMIDRFYECNARVQEKPAVRFFSEKCLPSFLPNVARDIYGQRAKEIIIVRDPRDIFCSAMSFNRKRGSLAFGAENHENDADWFRFIRHSFRHIAQAHDRRTEALTIRYEDLILGQRGTILKILRFLDVRDSDDVVDAIEACISRPESAFVNHMTSQTSKASISRWRFHEKLDIFKAEDDRYLSAMRAFGYS